MANIERNNLIKRLIAEIRGLRGRLEECTCGKKDE
jgi:hypothetical protein